jgi:hypothetical protein
LKKLDLNRGKAVPLYTTKSERKGSVLNTMIIYNGLGINP